MHYLKGEDKGLKVHSKWNNSKKYYVKETSLKNALKMENIGFKFILFRR